MASSERERHCRHQQPPSTYPLATTPCLVCGYYSLSEMAPTEPSPEPDRLFCLTCGAHHVL